MTINCRVSGCGKPRAGFSPFCSNHRARKRRHGHPEQQTISKADLKPFIQRVQARIASKPEASLWSICDQRWETCVNWAKDELTERIYIGWEREAAKEIVALAAHVPARDVVVTAVAMYLLQEHQPNLFKSDEAFWRQLVRRVRSLAQTSFAEWIGAADGRRRRTMKELRPKTSQFLGKMLAQLFGAAGVRLVQIEKREAEKKRQEAAAFGFALTEVE